MNEGRGTSANKTHLFNWLHNMSVQMVRREGMCILNMRGVCDARGVPDRPCVCVYVGDGGPYLPSQLAV